MAEFLDEIDGDFVVHTKTDADILAIVGSRIYPDAAPQDTAEAHIVYTQADGHRLKSHSGIDAMRTLALHVYAVSASQPTAARLAQLLEDHWLATEGTIGAGTFIQVCNGGIIDSSFWFANDSSDEKLFYKRLLLRMLLGR